MRRLLLLGAFFVLGVPGLVFGCVALRGPGREPVAVNASALALGKAVYDANCATCHGVRGEGEPNWKIQRSDGTYPAPPHDSTGHTWHHTDELLLTIIREGTQSNATGSFKPRMPAWGHVLTEQEILAVLDYLKTFWGPRERQWQQELAEQRGSRD